MKGFDPIQLAESLRPRMIDLKEKKVSISNLSGTSQEKDAGKHTRVVTDFFRAKVYTKPEEKALDPFRKEPARIASKKLTILEEKRKIVVPLEECNSAFLGQINGCNLRCWYCYVDDINRNADPQSGQFFSAEEYLIQFLVWSKKTQNSTRADEKLNILRLSGGEVFIVPEFIIWIIEAVEKYDLQDYLFIWVDCNLATGDFYWKYLNPEQRKKIANYRNIGFCVCYKGFDHQTFHENSGAKAEFFDQQFKMHKRLIDEGLDVYSYLYPVTTSTYHLQERLSAFMDRLIREIDKYAPLRLATPEIKIYSPTKKRLTPEREKAIENQWKAMKIWKEELKKRFNQKDLSLFLNEVPVKSG